MVDFIEDELRFLARHGFSPDDVYDAREQAQWYWKQRAKELGKEIVLGNPCEKRQHRLRTRAGHCVQCDIKKLAYLRRHTKPAFVYIAGSLAGRVLKIGTSEDPWARVERLCSPEVYGGFNDWSLIARVPVKEGGNVEDRALSMLGNYKIVRPYVKDGLPQDAIEMVSCSFSLALRALTRASSELARGEVWASPYASIYEFEQPAKVE